MLRREFQDSMEEIQVNTILIDGIEYCLIDTLADNGKNYYYFVNEANSNDVQVLTDSVKDGEEFFVSIESDNEFDQALKLFYEKYKDSEMFNKNTN